MGMGEARWFWIRTIRGDAKKFRELMNLLLEKN